MYCRRNSLAYPPKNANGCVSVFLNFLGASASSTVLCVRFVVLSKDPNHRVWFNGRKKIYALNNTVIVDHDGLFIYVDCGHPGSFHDVNILRQSDFHRKWRQYFRRDDEEREYLLGDPGYLGEEMYIMRRLGEREIPGDPNLLAIDAYNKMHAGYRVAVEWGIGGLKRKWKRMLKTFDCTK